MPIINDTYAETCGPDWQMVSGPGAVFIENKDAKESLYWVIGRVTTPTLDTGYTLPTAHGARSNAEAIIVPPGRRLWIRSAQPSGAPAEHAVLLTVTTLP